MQQPIVISLGGSMVVPSTGIDIVFLKNFHDLIMKEIANGHRFILIVGGGSTAREYMKAATNIVDLSDDDKDWLGIHATRINGHLLRTIFRDVAHPVMVKDPRRRLTWSESVLIAAGWKPGRSTDDIAVRLGKLYGADTVINLTNIDHVYDSDPKTNPNAKPFDHLTWPQFRKLVGATWSPGSNAPFDPVAAKFAHRHGIKVIIAKGDELENLDRIIKHEAFVGTIVE